MCDDDFGIDDDGCCTVRQEPCAPSCLTCCMPNNLNQCETCASGHYISNIDGGNCGACLDCNPCCAECSDGNENNCTACFSGFFLGPDSTCSRCPPECEECAYDSVSSGPVCTSCSFDSALVGGACVCDAPFVRDDITKFCVEKCWWGELAVNGVCGPSTNKAELFLENALPILGLVDADYCHPPYPIQFRGGYFNGDNTSVEITNFSTYQKGAFEMWARTKNPGGTLFSLDI